LSNTIIIVGTSCLRYLAAAPDFNPAGQVVFRRAAAYHRHMQEAEDIAALRRRLHEMQVEHRDLDEIVERLMQSPPHDQLMLRRLKKRKLLLKDRIAILERMIEPDVLA
jgi:hypothetical protein